MLALDTGACHNHENFDALLTHVPLFNEQLPRFINDLQSCSAEAAHEDGKRAHFIKNEADAQLIGNVYDTRSQKILLSEGLPYRIHRVD